MRAALVLLCAAASMSPVLAGCGGTAKTDDCRISVDCSVMPFPSQSGTSQPLAAIRSGPTFPPDPAAGAEAVTACPASFRPVEVYPALPAAHAYRGPIIVGFNAAIPAGWALWIGDLTTASAQEPQLLPAALPFPAALQPYPYANPATYAVAGDVTLRAGDRIVAYVVAPDGANCPPTLAETPAATARSTP